MTLRRRAALGMRKARTQGGTSHKQRYGRDKDDAWCRRCCPVAEVSFFNSLLEHAPQELVGDLVVELDLRHLDHRAE